MPIRRYGAGIGQNDLESADVVRLLAPLAKNCATPPCIYGLIVQNCGNLNIVSHAAEVLLQHPPPALQAALRRN